MDSFKKKNHSFTHLVQILYKYTNMSQNIIYTFLRDPQVLYAVGTGEVQIVIPHSGDRAET